MFALQSPETICRTLGARVRALRLARNLAQGELADMSGASLSTIRRLEAEGQGSLQLLVQVAQALQATEGLEPLFAPALRSIAEAEAAVHANARQRARKPRNVQRSGG